jgi:hypothetical protein
VHHFAVFSNWIMLRRTIMGLAADRDVVVDLSETRLVDHTVMEKLHELEMEFKELGRKLTIVGLEGHVPNSAHPLAVRTKVTPSDAKPSPTLTSTPSGNGHTTAKQGEEVAITAAKD